MLKQNIKTNNYNERGEIRNKNAIYNGDIKNGD